MTTDTDAQLEYRLEALTPAPRVKVILVGDITLSSGIKILERLWTDADYAAARSAVWDVSACELPAFNDLLRTAKYINKHKHGRGPDVVAFVSPAFASSALARAFRGFDRVLHLDLNFFGDAGTACNWLDKRLTAVSS